ncbi:MAG: adenylate kinase [Breznakia sp.]
MNILIMGGPGAGKGSMSTKIVTHFKSLHISTGDIFRSEMAKGTPLGLQAKAYMDQGLLVPDEVTNPMVKSFIEKQDLGNGYLLDGYPRTLNQAKAFDELVKGSDLEIHVILNLDIPFEKLAPRITGRRICKVCGSIYHIHYHPSKEKDVCDVCGGMLYQRKDDTIESLKIRLDEYTKNAEEILEYYQTKVITINADQTQDAVWNDIMNALGSSE